LRGSASTYEQKKEFVELCRQCGTYRYQLILIHAGGVARGGASDLDGDDVQAERMRMRQGMRGEWKINKS